MLVFLAGGHSRFQIAGGTELTTGSRREGTMCADGGARSVRGVSLPLPRMGDSLFFNERQQAVNAQQDSAKLRRLTVDLGWLLFALPTCGFIKRIVSTVASSVSFCGEARRREFSWHPSINRLVGCSLLARGRVTCSAVCGVKSFHDDKNKGL